MATSGRLITSATYLNPVYSRNFPDPFVLKYCGEYWAYCTGFWHDNRCFGILHSRDLVHWRELAGAMEPLPDGWPEYWAPEVTYDNGRFYMYYSVGNEEHMQIRVAVAEHPAGPFIDSGRRLTTEDFAIDAHVFIDDDGTRYLFYATDFLEHSHIGTGTVRDQLLDPWTLAGQPRPVTRACYDWQVYDPQRAEKGGVRWHTVEGPFVLKHKGRYYQMFSGGNWKNVTYGVSFATSDNLATPDEWLQECDGERVLPILRTLPGQIVGPGHNSVVRGPDNLQLFCVYHRWVQDNSGRLLSIDRLDWAGERMIVLGPSITPQPVPALPTFTDFFDTDQTGEPGSSWRCIGGRWVVQDGAMVQQSYAATAEARCLVNATSFVSEVSLRVLHPEVARHDNPGAFGVSLQGDQGSVLRFVLAPGQGQAVVTRQAGGRWLEQQIALPPGFVPNAYHLVRLEVDGMHVKIALDDVAVHWQGRLDVQAISVALLTQGMPAAFAGFALTVGWQDLFMQQGVDPAEIGWHVRNAEGDWRIGERQLWHTNLQGQHAIIAKGTPLVSYELVLNARLDHALPGGCYGFYPALGSDGHGTLLTVERSEAGWVLLWHGTAGTHAFPLPMGFDPSIYQQFRFCKQHGRLMIQYEALVLGEIEVPHEATQVGLYAHQAVAAFDMVRVMAIEEVI